MASAQEQVQQTATSIRRQKFPEVFETVGGTPVVLFSLPVADSSVLGVSVKAITYRDDFTSTAMSAAEATFRRTSGGNVVRATGLGGATSALLRSVGDFLSPQPSIDLIANTATNAVDIRATGRAGMTLKWVLEITTLRNL